MPIKIDIFTLKLIRENLLYLFFLIFVVLLFVLIIPFQVKRYFDYAQKIKSVGKEIKQLEAKEAIISTVNPDEVDELIAALDRLLPKTEDYFSIIYALENISYQTGFRISSYSVKFDNKKSTKTQLKIEGEGDLDSFINFLKSYQFKSGRLITINNIKFSSENLTNSLTLNFYTKEVKNLKEPTRLVIDKEGIDKIKQIAKKLKSTKLDFLESSSDLDLDYPTKDNPFAL